MTTKTLENKKSSKRPPRNVGNGGEMVGKWCGVSDLLAQHLAAFRCHVTACHEITEYSLSLPTFHSRSP